MPWFIGTDRGCGRGPEAVMESALAWKSGVPRNAKTCIITSGVYSVPFWKIESEKIRKNREKKIKSQFNKFIFIYLLSQTQTGNSIQTVLLRRPFVFFGNLLEFDAWRSWEYSLSISLKFCVPWYTLTRPGYLVGFSILSRPLV